MSRTITGNNGAISLNPATDNRTYVEGVTIESNTSTALYAPSGATWTITNSGLIISDYGNGAGVAIASSGQFVNGTVANNGYVGGSVAGLLFSAGTGTVANYGTIRANSTHAYGITLAAGGTITNGGTSDTSARIEAVSSYASAVGINGGGTVLNFGTISGGAGNHGGGIVLNGGGAIVNGASNGKAALITGSEEAIQINGTAGATVTNAGTITGTVGISGSNGVVINGTRSAAVGS